jgi:hypothetical protein
MVSRQYSYFAQTMLLHYQFKTCKSWRQFVFKHASGMCGADICITFQFALTESPSFTWSLDFDGPG